MPSRKDYKNWTAEQKAEDLKKQRERRARKGNQYVKSYEKTEKGFLVRLYRNMKSRIEGVQTLKKHLYENKELLSKDEFYTWALKNEDFKALFKGYCASGYDRKLAPSVDRVDSSKGYTLDNMEFVTMSENSRRGAISQRRLE